MTDAIKHRYFFGTVHSYDEFLATALREFMAALGSGDLDTAEDVLMVLAAALPKEVKEDKDGRAGAFTILQKYMEERDKLSEELRKCLFLACENRVRHKIKYVLIGAFNEIINLMDEAGLLVRKAEKSIPIH